MAENVPAPPPQRRKKHKHAPHHGGAWKVAFADFMTSMFALFLVLWIISTTSASQRAGIASYFKSPTLFKPGSNKPANFTGTPNPIDAQALPSEAPDQQAENERMRQLDSVLSSDSVLQQLGSQFQTQMTDKGLRIELTDAGELGFFELGSARLNPKVKEAMGSLAQALGAIPNKVVVAGHTDKYGYSGANSYSNWELSADRANSVREHMLQSGLATDRFSAVIGYGDNELANPENPYAPENRRVTLLVLRNSERFKPY